MQMHCLNPFATRGTVVALLCSMFALAAGAADDKPKAGAPAPAKAALTVTAVQPQRADIATTLAANGNIAAWQEAIVGAQGSGWQLAEVRVNVGDVVKRGQVLARFVADLAQADLAQSKATVAEAEAMLAEEIGRAHV